MPSANPPQPLLAPKRWRAVWARAIDSGQEFATTDRERRHLRSTVLMGLVCVAVSLPYVVILAALDTWLVSGFLAVACVGYLSPLWLLPRGRAALGKAIPLFSISFVAYVFTCLLGKESNVHLALFMAVGWAFNIFDLSRERIFFWASQVVPWATFMLVQLGFTPTLADIEFSGMPKLAMQHSVGGVCFALLSLVLHHFYRKNQADEDMLVESLVKLRAEMTKRAEAERQAVSASQAKSDFLAMMGHELRTPLNGVLGMSQLLRETPLSTDQHGLLDSLDSSGRVLLMLFNDILDFVSIRTGDVKVASVPTDLPMLVEDIVCPLGEAAREKGIAFDLLIETNVPTIAEVDPSRLRQVVAVVAQNALKYTERGRVLVNVSMPVAGQLQVDVTDTGRGIAMARQSAIFDEFSQERGGVSRSNTGIGLGLATCRMLLEAMKGRISLLTSSEHGSHFRIEVPIGVPAQPDSDASLAGLVVQLDLQDRGVAAVLSHAVERLGGAVASEEEATGGTNLRITDGELSPESGVVPNLRVSRRPEGDPRSIDVQSVRGSSLKRRLEPFVRQNQPPSSFGDGCRVPKVLVVEDNPVNQKVLCGMLAKMGIQTDVVENGRLAVDACRGHSYDLVLMDVEMPVMNGLDATRAIRAAVGASLPIIGVSANAAPQEQERGLQAGMDVYLPKPVRKQQLVDTLQRYLVGMRLAS